MNCYVKTIPTEYMYGTIQNNGDEKRASLRIGLYAIINFLFLLCSLLLSLIGDRVGHDPFAYLVMLFALCSIPLIFVREVNGPYCLMVVSVPVLFVFYGINDILSYLVEIPGYYAFQTDGVLTTGEVAILLGISAWYLGYFFAVKSVATSKNKVLILDWKIRDLIWVGLLCLSFGLWATWVFQSSSHDGSTELDGNNILALIVLGRMLEPVGTVLLVYSYFKSKSRALFVLILAIGIAKLPMGIILNSKEIGVSFIAIFMVAKWLYDGSVPLRWIAIAAVIVTFYFPLSYAYRATIGARHMSAGQSLANVGDMLDKAMEENKKTGDSTEGIKSFAGRVDLKSLMELIISRTGQDVAYQNGHTFSELPYVFIPRFLIDKPQVSAGQLFNREFHISANPNTYISTSFLGELYWNFSWTGVLVGMAVVGYTWGFIGARSNLLNAKSVTRLLLLVSAIYLFSLRFEAGIAQQYVVFIRSTGIILLLHLVFRSRQPALKD